MLNYVNVFTCASNRQNTFVIHFFQNEPVVVPGGNSDPNCVEIITNQVSSIVMDREGLKTLHELVTGMLEDCETHNMEK